MKDLIQILGFIVDRPNVALIIAGALVALLFFVTKAGPIVLRKDTQRYLLAVGAILLASGICWTVIWPSTEVLKPTWVYQSGVPIQVSNNQILSYSRNASPDGERITIDVSLSGALDFSIKSVKAPTRWNFDYNGKKYRLTVLAVKNSGACIEIDRGL